MRYKIIIPVHFRQKFLLDKFKQRLATTIKPVLHPNTEIVMESLPEGAMSCIQSRTDLYHNSLYVLEIAKATQNTGVDGIFVTDMDMCGVDIAREHLTTAIIGGFSANAYTALALGRKFSIITILDEVVDMQMEHIYSHALTDRFASVRVAHAPVSELLDNSEATLDRVFQEAQTAIEKDGAQALILGCTGFIGIADQVRKRLLAKNIDVPVLDPNRVAMSFLQHLVINDLYQSKRTYMPPASEPKHHNQRSQIKISGQSTASV